MRFTRIKGLIEHHDIVMVGYRGVDGSVVLDCPEVDDFFANRSGDFTERATLDIMAEAYSSCAIRLQKEGIDTDGYTVTEVVQDMEATRIALGYDRINLVSESYGTRLAMIYAWIAAGDGDWSGMALLSMAIDFMVEGASVWGESATRQW